MNDDLEALPDAPLDEPLGEVEEIQPELSELDRLRAERDEMRTHAQRVQADFENFRKQVTKRVSADGERATEGLVEGLLPVLDSFELCMGQIGDETEPNLRKGIQLVYAEFLAVLEKAGLERIDALGKPFDPTEHEAVISEEGDGEPMVAEILRGGYRLRGRVIRPAMVKVAG